MFTRRLARLATPSLRRHVNIAGREYPAERAAALEAFAAANGFNSTVWVTATAATRAGVALKDGAVPLRMQLQLTASTTSDAAASAAAAVPDATLELFNADQTTDPASVEARAHRSAFSTLKGLSGINFTAAAARELQAGSEKFRSQVWATAHQLATLGVALKPDAGQGIVLSMMRSGPAGEKSLYFNADQTTDAALCEAIANSPTPITLLRGRQPFWLLLAKYAARCRRPLSPVWATESEYRLIGVAVPPGAPRTEVFVELSGSVLQLVNAIDTADVKKAEAVAQLNADKRSRAERERQIARRAQERAAKLSPPSGGRVKKETESQHKLATDDAVVVEVPTPIAPEVKAASNEQISWT